MMKTQSFHLISSSSATAAWMLFVLVVACFQLDSTHAEPCPKPNPNIKSTGNADTGAESTKVEIFHQQEGYWHPIQLYWVDYDGNEKYVQETTPGGGINMDTYAEHYWRVYTTTDSIGRVLLKEFTPPEDGKVEISEFCDEAKEAVLKDLDKEMSALVHDQAAPCLPADDSSRWSCIHRISKEDYDKRLEQWGGIKYGFNDTVESQTREVGATIDRVHSGQIPKIPRLTLGPGYLKMSFTNKMKELLLPWYEEHKKGGPKDSVYKHRVIPGGFTNSHTVPMSILNLDSYPGVKNKLIHEMQRVLEWWTNRPLQSTSTFGLRVYHRESMLINHVDRSDTHLASAVIQVDQDGVDEGWPLEVMHPDGSCGEVYLQPGEMVLYEGARFAHGRPMRFNGTDFANIFSHFRPLDWHGPHKSPSYDGLLDSDGYRRGDRQNDEL